MATGRKTGGRAKGTPNKPKPKAEDPPTVAVHRPERGAKTGRPSKYDPSMVERARQLAASGAVDHEIAEALEIGLTTFYRWQAEFREFRDALKRGKNVADDAVEAALFRRATGYSHDAVKIMSVSRGANMGSEIEEVPYVEHIAPDTTAAIFWLKNRRPAQWREMAPVKLEAELSDDELRERIRALDDQIAVAAGAGGKGTAH